METKFRRFGEETRFKRLGDETRFNKFAVDTRFNRLGVLTSPTNDADERYPALPRPITVDWRFGSTIGCCPFKVETKKLLTVV